METKINSYKNKYFKNRCKDCACLVAGTNDEWICDELNKPCADICRCPEGMSAILSIEQVEDLRKMLNGKKVRIVELCNDEKNYKPGDIGEVQHIDDAGGIHVRWDKGGDMALLPDDKFDFWNDSK